MSSVGACAAVVIATALDPLVEASATPSRVRRDVTGLIAYRSTRRLNLITHHSQHSGHNKLYF